MKLRNPDSQRSVVSDAPEGESPTPLRSRMTMWIYVLFLFGILALGVWYGVYAYFHYEVRGHIRVDRTVISSHRGGRVLEIWPSEGDDVQRGDSLVLVEPGEPCEPPDSTELRAAQEQLRLTRVRMQNTRQTLARKRRQLTRLQERTALELNNFETRRNRLQDEIHDLQSELNLLRARLRLARRASDRLERHPRTDVDCVPFVISAPHSGRIHRVHANEFSVVDAGAPVMSLTPSTPQVAVLAYVPNDLAEYVHRADTVTIRSPDGLHSAGVIRTMYSSAQEFARLKWNGYDPLPSRTLVEIAPLGASIRKQWRALDRADVEVRGQTGSLTSSTFAQAATNAERGSGPASSDSSSAPPTTWTIVAGSYEQRANARVALRTLRNRIDTTAASLLLRPSEDGTTNRVTLGLFESKQAAMSARRTLRRHLSDEAWLLPIAEDANHSSPGKVK